MHVLLRLLIWLSAFASQCSGIRVTIVGSGIAGVTAARALLDHSPMVHVTVLEANPDRHGGRLWSYPIPGHPGAFLEFGAMWLHGYADPTQPIRIYCAEHGIHTIPNLYSKTNAQVFVGDDVDVFKDRDYLPELQDTFDVVADLGRKADFKFNAPERSLREVFEDEKSKLREIYDNLKSPMDRFLVLFLEDEEGTKFDNISTRSYPPIPDESEERAAEDMGFGNVVPAGYITILDSIAKGNQGSRPVRIILDQEVNKIQQKGRTIKVFTKGGKSYASDYLIVAVPLGVLKANVITWEPPLTRRRQQAIQRMGTGNFVKGVLIFDKQFWPHDKEYMFFFPSNKDRNHIDRHLPRVYFVSLVPVNNVTGLVAILNGPYADLADSLTEDALKELLIDVLKVIHGPEFERVNPTVTYFHRTDWRTNPLFRGAYSYGKLGMLEDDPEELRKPIRNRIFFAGEHTMFDQGTSASIVGAYESGILAAEELIDNMC